MDLIFTFILGLLLRIGIPVTVTALVLFLLKRLDERWQKEALALPVVNTRQPCWEKKGCAEAKRKSCLAYNQFNIPCWQVFRTNNGRLQEGCLECDVFRLAPVPTLNI